MRSIAFLFVFLGCLLSGLPTAYGQALTNDYDRNTQYRMADTGGISHSAVRPYNPVDYHQLREKGGYGIGQGTLIPHEVGKVVRKKEDDGWTILAGYPILQRAGRN